MILIHVDIGAVWYMYTRVSYIGRRPQSNIRNMAVFPAPRPYGTFFAFPFMGKFPDFNARGPTTGMMLTRCGPDRPQIYLDLPAFLAVVVFRREAAEAVRVPRLDFRSYILLSCEFSPGAS